jgi:lipopolysaccharide/colanic/teichoic acid biosynthesis glycosyltransferase
MIRAKPVESQLQVQADQPQAVGSRANLAAKRSFDLVAACVLLALVSPLLAIVAVIVLVTSPGSPLFRQTRLGQDRRPFVLYKFRTMYDRSPNDVHREYVSRLLTDDQPPTGGRQGLFKLENDPRVTPIGRLLRRTSIDELPQLLNVIRGEMSLVGPRPVLPWEGELIGSAYSDRFLVKPGITGLWQISGRNKLAMRQGFALDVDYVSNQSFWFDLVILLKTVPVVLSTRGAR